MSVHDELKARFMERIDRRLQFLDQLREAGLGVYLPPDKSKREQAVSALVQATIRGKERGMLNMRVIADAQAQVMQRLEAQQNLLPHDVQFKNRIRSSW